MKKIPVLFTMKDSVYNTFPNCDCWDENRNALNYSGNSPIIAHPPCRLWSRMRKFSSAPESEKELALFALSKIRQNGGILEHPAYSMLWKQKDLPLGKDIDMFGGFTLSVDQFWFGHQAKKNTWLYIVGLKPSELPDYPVNLSDPDYTCCFSRSSIKKPEIPKKMRQATPKKFAEFLIEIIQIINKNKPYERN